MQRARRSCAGSSSSELCGNAAQASMQVQAAGLAVRHLWRTASGQRVPRSVADIAAQRQQRAWLCTSQERFS